MTSTKNLQKIFILFSLLSVFYFIFIFVGCGEDDTPDDTSKFFTISEGKYEVVKVIDNLTQEDITTTWKNENNYKLTFIHNNIVIENNNNFTTYYYKILNNIVYNSANNNKLYTLTANDTFYANLNNDESLNFTIYFEKESEVNNFTVSDGVYKIEKVLKYSNKANITDIWLQENLNSNIIINNNISTIYIGNEFLRLNTSLSNNIVTNTKTDSNLFLVYSNDRFIYPIIKNNVNYLLYFVFDYVPTENNLENGIYNVFKVIDRNTGVEITDNWIQKYDCKILINENNLQIDCNSIINEYVITCKNNEIYNSVINQYLYTIYDNKLIWDMSLSNSADVVVYFERTGEVPILNLQMGTYTVLSAYNTKTANFETETFKQKYEMIITISEDSVEINTNGEKEILTTYINQNKIIQSTNNITLFTITYDNNLVWDMTNGNIADYILTLKYEQINFKNIQNGLYEIYKVIDKTNNQEITSLWTQQYYCNIILKTENLKLNIQSITENYTIGVVNNNIYDIENNRLLFSISEDDKIIWDMSIWGTANYIIYFERTGTAEIPELKLGNYIVHSVFDITTGEYITESFKEKYDLNMTVLSNSVTLNINGNNEITTVYIDGDKIIDKLTTLTYLTIRYDGKLIWDMRISGTANMIIILEYTEYKTYVIDNGYYTIYKVIDKSTNKDITSNWLKQYDIKMLIVDSNLKLTINYETLNYIIEISNNNIYDLQNKIHLFSISKDNHIVWDMSNNDIANYILYFERTGDVPVYSIENGIYKAYKVYDTRTGVDITDQWIEQYYDFAITIEDEIIAMGVGNNLQTFEFYRNNYDILDAETNQVLFTLDGYNKFVWDMRISGTANYVVYFQKS